VRIGSDIRLTILGVRGNQVRIGIDAPDGVQILREELLEVQVTCSHDKSVALIPT
jgi:carbon storage regulator